MSRTDAHTRPQHIPELDQPWLHNTESPETLADADIANIGQGIFSKARNNAIGAGPTTVRDGQVSYIGSVDVHFVEFKDTLYGERTINSHDVLTVPMLSSFLSNELSRLVLVESDMDGILDYGVDESTTRFADQFCANFVQRITDTTLKVRKSFYSRIGGPREVVSLSSGAPGVAGLMGECKVIDAPGVGRRRFVVTYHVYVGPSYRQRAADLVDERNQSSWMRWHSDEPADTHIERNRHYPRKWKDGWCDSYAPNPVKKARSANRAEARDIVKLTRNSINLDELDDLDF